MQYEKQTNAYKWIIGNCMIFYWFILSCCVKNGTIDSMSCSYKLQFKSSTAITYHYFNELLADCRFSEHLLS